MSFPFLLLPFLLKARNAQAEMDKKLYEKTLINLSCSRQVSIRLFNQSLYGMKLTFSTHYNASGEASNWIDTALYVSALVAVPTCTFNRRLRASKRLKDLLFSQSKSKINVSRLEHVGGSWSQPHIIGSRDRCHVVSAITWPNCETLARLWHCPSSFLLVMSVYIYNHLFPSPSCWLFSLTREKCVGVLDMILGALICSPRSNRVCSYPGLEPRGFLAEGFPEVSWSGHTSTTVHVSSLFLSLPLLLLLPHFSLLLCLCP